MAIYILLVRLFLLSFLLPRSGAEIAFSAPQDSPNTQIVSVAEVEQAEEEISDARVFSAVDPSLINKEGKVFHLWRGLSTHRENSERHYLNRAELLLPSPGISQLIFPFHFFF